MSKKEITWSRTKHKWGCEIRYKNKILKHKDHISISKEMYVNNKLKRIDLTHIPSNLIKKIQNLTKD